MDDKRFNWLLCNTFCNKKWLFVALRLFSAYNQQYPFFIDRTKMIHK